MKKRGFLFLIAAFLVPLVLIPGGFIYGAETVLTQEELSQVKEAGTYKVRAFVETDSGPVEKVINVTITYTGTVISENIGEGIDASDFKVKPGVMGTLSDEDLIASAKAHAWSLKTGESVPVKVVSKDDGTKREGFYSVTFGTDEGAQVTVSAVIGNSVFTRMDYMQFRETNIKDSSLTYVLHLLFSFLFLLPILLILLSYYMINRQMKKVRKALFKEEK